MIYLGAMKSYEPHEIICIIDSEYLQLIALTASHRLPFLTHLR